MLAKNFIMRCIDLAGMPHEVFRYYVSGFMRYVESASESEDAIGFNVARLLDAIDSHFEDCPALEMQFWTENSDFIRRIGQLLTKLNVTSEVHAELFSRVKSKPATPF